MEGRSDLSIGPALRRSRSDGWDEFLRGLLPDTADRADTATSADTAASAPAAGIALVAVGGYGRRELAPGSDLDVVLLHDASLAPAEVREIAEKIWYPVWDSGMKLDHSVRTVAEARELARVDLAVAAGLLDARCVAGDESLVRAVRGVVFGDWRREAARRLGELRAEFEDRRGRHGELAYRLEGDLKESHGGLRDSTMLRFISASWLVDVPHGEPETARAFLLDVRDALHVVSGRALDRLLLQEQDAVAVLLAREGYAEITDADVLMRRVADAAGVVAYAAESAWRQVDSALAARNPARRPVRRPLADGVVEQDGEIYLARAALPSRDPVLALRAAAAAAVESGLYFAPHTLRRLADESAPLPRPWPPAARESLVALLGSGPGLIPVWNALDRSGILAAILPEWQRIRSLPQRNSLHIHTVDRHTLETVVRSAELTRSVGRPDLLLAGALLHDIGKGLPGDHSEIGAVLTADLAAELGFPAGDVRILTGMVRHHLLIPDLATRRDPDDPATLGALLTALADLPCPRLEALRLLYALTLADSQATGPAAWNPWRAGLFADLVVRAEAELLGFDPPVAEPCDSSRADFAARCATEDFVVEFDGPATLSVATQDRIGVLALVAGVLSLRHLQIRAATTETIDGIAVQTWTVASDWDADATRLRTDLRAALAGTLDVDARLASRDSSAAGARSRLVAPPSVSVLDGASASATVLEVRAHDSPGLLYRITAALATERVSVRSARISTLGAEAVDVFYVVDALGGPLPAMEAARVAAAVAGVLGHRHQPY